LVPLRPESAEFQPVGNTKDRKGAAVAVNLLRWRACSICEEKNRTSAARDCCQQIQTDLLQGTPFGCQIRCRCQNRANRHRHIDFCPAWQADSAGESIGVAKSGCCDVKRPQASVFVIAKTQGNQHKTEPPTAE
jgi:hypothetical protein